jgi:hypothetical protein
VTHTRGSDWVDVRTAAARDWLDHLIRPLQQAKQAVQFSGKVSSLFSPVLILSVTMVTAVVRLSIGRCRSAHLAHFREGAVERLELEGGCRSIERDPAPVAVTAGGHPAIMLEAAFRATSISTRLVTSRARSSNALPPG